MTHHFLASVHDGPVLMAAPVWRRAVAGVVDVLLALPVAWFAVVAGARLTDAAFWAGNVPFYEHWAVVFSISPLLFVALVALAASVVAAVRYPFEVVWGASPGDRLMGLVLVDGSGFRPGWLRLLVREMAFVLGAAPFGLGLAWTLWDWARRPFHDKVASVHLVVR